MLDCITLIYVFVIESFSVPFSINFKEILASLERRNTNGEKLYGCLVTNLKNLRRIFKDSKYRMETGGRRKEFLIL